MNRIFKSISMMLVAAAAFVGCNRAEIVGTPDFTLLTADGDACITMTSMEQYTIDLTYLPYRAAKATDQIAADMYGVKSNCSWRFEAAGDDQDWCTPYPDHGDKEGVVRFFTTRNYDQVNARTAAFKVYINDGQREIPVGGLLLINQAAAVDFLKLNVAKVEVNKEGGNANVTVTSNVPWTYSLTPVADYASPEIEEWIEDRTKLKYEDEDSTILSVSNTLKFRLSDNSDGSIRGAELNVICPDYPDLSQKIVITQYGVEVEVSGFPVKWHAANNNFPKWASKSNPLPTLTAFEGAGTITYHIADIAGLDRSASSTDVSGSNPRINGAWPGDYLEFNTPTPVSAGSLIKLVFEGRISGSGIKHWALTYKDGSEWKYVTTPTTETIEGFGEITYTHDMAPGGSADDFNKVISAVVRYTNTTDEVAFRFAPVSTVIASSLALMEKPTTASARLDYSGAEGAEPEISCVASGGELKTAEIIVKDLEKDFITFESKPEKGVTFSIESDEDFNLSADVDWLHFDKTQGTMEDGLTVTVTCDPSDLTKMREGKILILAGVTRKYIPVVQSAASQELESFISVVGGNTKNIDADVQSFKVKLQTNSEYAVEIPADVDWISTEPLTKGVVVEEVELYCSANTATEERSAVINFVNEAKGLVAPLKVIQAAAAPSGETVVSWTFSKDAMTDYKDAFEKSNSLPAAKGTGYISWVDLPENVALDVNAKKTHVIGGTGEPYVTGAWVGDYWEFTVPNVTVPAGSSVTFDAVTRCSGTGHKYWAMMYLDGTEWKYVKETATESESAQKSTYTHILTSDNQNFVETFKLTKGLANEPLKIRFICTANWQCGGAGALAAPNGGTHRWSVPAGTVQGPVITIKEPQPVLKAQWLFHNDPAQDAYVETFGGAAGTFANAAGDNGFKVESNVKSSGKGCITFVQVDKTAIAPADNPKYSVGSTGHPFMTGVWPGDYWYFTATDQSEYPAGTKLHVKFLTRISATGQKYWMLEGWDGEAWQPLEEVKTETETGTNAQYNFIEPTSNATVDETWTLAKACTTMQFRMRCVANWQSNGKGALAAPNGGTCRLASDTADLLGTSPVFEVVE